MSIINNAHPGSQIRLVCLIDRVLNRRKKKSPILRQELIETCRPEYLPDSEGAKKRFAENLTFWLEEGLWKKSDEGIDRAEETASEQNLSIRVLELCIKQSVDENLVHKEGRIEPFLRTITVLLAQDQFSFQGQQRGTQSLVRPRDIAEAVNSRLSSDLSINESNEANTLKDWSLFLGLLEPFGKGVVVDPTRAIAPFLPELFANKDSLQIRDFIAALAERFPMLDGGRYRQVVESLMEEKGWQRPFGNRVSASLSHAILRMEAGLQLILEQPSDDSRSMIVITPNGKERSVGTVRYRGKGDGFISILADA